MSVPSVEELVKKLGHVVITASTRAVPKVFVNIGELKASNFIDYNPPPYANLRPGDIFPDTSVRLKWDWANTFIEMRDACNVTPQAIHRYNVRMLITLRTRLRQLYLIFLNLDIAFMFTRPLDNDIDMRNYVYRFDQGSYLRTLYIKTLRNLTNEIDVLRFYEYRQRFV